MATVTPSVKDISKDGSVFLISWLLTTADNDGAPIDGIEWADRSMLCQSVAWGGATVGLEGSNDGGAVYVPLADPQGGAISKSANAIEAVLELTRLMRPRLTTVGTAASITVSIIARRANPLRT